MVIMVLLMVMMGMMMSVAGVGAELRPPFEAASLSAISQSVVVAAGCSMGNTDRTPTLTVRGSVCVCVCVCV